MNAEGTRSRRDIRRSWIPWLALAPVLVIALGVGMLDGEPQTRSERVTEIAKTVKCPVCLGETVDESSTDLARTIRRDITEKVDEGKTSEQIYEFLGGKYSDNILLTPRAGGLVGLVWVIPVVAFIVSLAWLVVVFRRWSASDDAHATPEDRELVKRALGAQSSE